MEKYKFAFATETAYDMLRFLDIDRADSLTDEDIDILRSGEDWNCNRYLYLSTGTDHRVLVYDETSACVCGSYTIDEFFQNALDYIEEEKKNANV